MSTWDGGTPAPQIRISALGWLCIAYRLPLIGLVNFGGLLLLLSLRLIERPLFGMDRPVTPWITQAVCRTTLRIMGLRLRATGPRMKGPGAVVANHSSWLDIFVLNSRKNVYFVAKQEVSGWAGIGWLARATGTVFIKRDRREAKAQTQVFQDRLLHGHRLLFFPEGTSTDNQRVLPFKTTLFAAFFDDALRERLQVQAVSVSYQAPKGREPYFYGWWGGMDFAPYLLHVLGQPCQGSVTLTYHPPVRVADFADRKALAATLEQQTRGGFSLAR
ncbi:lysophospholipid acyltransferase family protein [Tropicibacter naphthalenivorans]|uniref:2-acyl-glycerophospho-ethanolamine acyltransferase n=1 Tax=Tropicibacter naphthalenivorans TaxID=441103 RepID=A0A0P1G7W5_9RHOB|nr:lysophospholipid acyltransferase family protein [Tropicibacter naphthalenivorans]CUH77674.1 2-acyl-glycerophospho-ethanolamine acyltransferase [Tropicibacter naphthalenivorans]SMC54365.1 lyso-ornithine lipid acyltransferase [Tropicibacter naphthalenivorans]